MSESGDYDPGPWKGHNFASARKVYDAHVGRSYDDALVDGKDPESLIPNSLTTNSESPLVIACDVTGSMGDWPATIFSKLPYLEVEGKEYMGDTMEISFAAVGDAYCDDYPFQVRPFVSGTGLKDELKEFVVEGGGGGQIMESYDLAAVYYANKAEMPNATKPLFIFIGDECLYDFVDEAQAERWARTSLEGRLSSVNAIRRLQNKFSVYLIQKPYGSSGEGRSNFRDPDTQRVYTQWADILGEDHIAYLPQAQRVVDVIFGIMAKETARIPYFEGELTERQKPGQVTQVLKSLNTIHNLPGGSKKLLPGMSVTRGKSKGSKGKDAGSLI
jgi:hypothetical protein